MTHFLTKKNKEYVLELIKQTIGTHYKMNLEELQDYSKIYNQEARKIQERNPSISLIEKNKIIIGGFINIYKDIYRYKLENDANSFASINDEKKDDSFILPTYETQLPTNNKRDLHDELSNSSTTSTPSPLLYSPSQEQQQQQLSSSSLNNNSMEHIITVNDNMTFDNSLRHLTIQKLIFSKDEEELLPNYYIKTIITNKVKMFFQKYISDHHIVYEPYNGVSLEPTNREQKIDVYLGNNQMFNSKKEFMLFCTS